MSGPAQNLPIESNDVVRASVQPAMALFRSIELQNSFIYFYGICYPPLGPLVGKAAVGSYCGTRARISGTSVTDALSEPRFGCREAPCTSRGRNSARELISIRYRPVLDAVLPTPCPSLNPV
jgi:hypothetical protein